MAEGVGFEPTVGFPTLDFESSALNRTQPPFPEDRRKNAERPTSNIQYRMQLSSRLGVGRLHSGIRLARYTWRQRLGRRVVNRRTRQIDQKCYNFGLAMPADLTASCMSTRTATLLLVVDRYSQVLGAAVHQYSHLIRNLNPPSPP